MPLLGFFLDLALTPNEGHFPITNTTPVVSESLDVVTENFSETQESTESTSVVPENIIVSTEGAESSSATPEDPSTVPESVGETEEEYRTRVSTFLGNFIGPSPVPPAESVLNITSPYVGEAGKAYFLAYLFGELPEVNTVITVPPRSEPVPAVVVPSMQVLLDCPTDEFEAPIENVSRPSFLENTDIVSSPPIIENTTPVASSSRPSAPETVYLIDEQFGAFERGLTEFEKLDFSMRFLEKFESLCPKAVVDSDTDSGESSDEDSDSESESVYSSLDPFSTSADHSSFSKTRNSIRELLESFKGEGEEEDEAAELEATLTPEMREEMEEEEQAQEEEDLHQAEFISNLLQAPEPSLEASSLWHFEQMADGTLRPVAVTSTAGVNYLTSSAPYIAVSAFVKSFFAYLGWFFGKLFAFFHFKPLFMLPPAHPHIHLPPTNTNSEGYVNFLPAPLSEQGPQPVPKPEFSRASSGAQLSSLDLTINRPPSLFTRILNFFPGFNDLLNPGVTEEDPEQLTADHIAGLSPAFRAILTESINALADSTSTCGLEDHSPYTSIEEIRATLKGGKFAPTGLIALELSLAESIDLAVSELRNAEAIEATENEALRQAQADKASASKALERHPVKGGVIPPEAVSSAADYAARSVTKMINKGDTSPNMCSAIAQAAAEVKSNFITARDGGAPASELARFRYIFNALDEAFLEASLEELNEAEPAAAAANKAVNTSKATIKALVEMRSAVLERIAIYGAATEQAVVNNSTFGLTGAGITAAAASGAVAAVGAGVAESLVNAVETTLDSSTPLSEATDLVVRALEEKLDLSSPVTSACNILSGTLDEEVPIPVVNSLASALSSSFYETGEAEGPARVAHLSTRDVRSFVGPSEVKTSWTPILYEYYPIFLFCVIFVAIGVFSRLAAREQDHARTDTATNYFFQKEDIKDIRNFTEQANHFIATGKQSPNLPGINIPVDITVKEMKEDIWYAEKYANLLESLDSYGYIPEPFRTHWIILDNIFLDSVYILLAPVGTVLGLWFSNVFIPMLMGILFCVEMVLNFCVYLAGFKIVFISSIILLFFTILYSTVYHALTLYAKVSSFPFYGA